MPPFRIAFVHWGNNTFYATRRATQTEIEDIVAFVYRAESRTAVPITAWEKR